MGEGDWKYTSTECEVSSGNEAIENDAVNFPLNPMAVESRSSKEIVVTIKDSEMKTDCENSEKGGRKRSAMPPKKPSQLWNDEVFRFF